MRVYVIIDFVCRNQGQLLPCIRVLFHINMLARYETFRQNILIFPNIQRRFSTNIIDVLVFHQRPSVWRELDTSAPVEMSE